MVEPRFQLTGDRVVPSFSPRGHNIPLGTLLEFFPPRCGHTLRLCSVHNLDPFRSLFTDTRAHPIDRPVRPFLFVFLTCFLDFSQIREPERELRKLDCGRSSSGNCRGNTPSANTQFAVISLWTRYLRVAVPVPSGEKDWRSWGRGGRAPDLKATSTSGEDTTQTCGLSDTGSVGAISRSAGDEARQSGRRSTRHRKIKAIQARILITTWDTG